MNVDHELDCNHDHTEQLTRRIDELARELDALRSELQHGSLTANGERPTAGVASTNSLTIEESVNGEVDGGEQASMSRRNALRAAGVLAAGAVAGGVGLVAAATPAAAASGTFDGSPAVTANGGSDPGSRAVDAGVQGSNGIAVYADSSGSNGIAVLASSSGVEGVAVSAASSGVLGVAVSAVSVGVDGVAVSGASVGQGSVGVRGDGVFSGVWGSSDSGVGVYGATMGQFAVYGESGGVGSDSTGVYGKSTSGRGLSGQGDVGVYAQSLNVGVSIDAEQTSLRFSNAATSPLTSGGTYQARDIVVDSAGVMWFCVAGGTPGTWRMLSGPSTAGAFTPLTPGRVYDSRLATYSPNGALGSGQDRTISVANSYDTGGTRVTTNFVPAGASAVFANVTVVETAGNGWLAVNPGGTTTVSASSINWSASGQILANGLSLTLNTNRQITVVNGSPGSTQFIVDILGYYR
jgi:hypothetical protein